MKKRIGLLSSAIFFTGLIGAVNATEKGPGDDGYMHERFHDAYQALFQTIGCSCGVGECRPTEWRTSSKSPKGYAVLIDGHWVDLPAATKMANPNNVDAALMAFPAHVCAYGSYPSVSVPCALITNTGADLNLPTWFRRG